MLQVVVQNNPRPKHQLRHFDISLGAKVPTQYLEKLFLKGMAFQKMKWAQAWKKSLGEELMTNLIQPADRHVSFPR